MNIMYLLIGCSIVIAVGFLLAFLWSVRSGQYDDTDTPSMRMLMDEIKVREPEENIAKMAPKEECS